MERLKQTLFFLLLLTLPTQLGRHFWPSWTQILGLRVDYLSPRIYLTDIFIFLLFLFFLPQLVSFLKRARQEKTKVLAGLIFFLAFLSLRILKTQTPAIGFYQLLKFMEFAFFAFYLTQALKTYQQFEKAMMVLSFGVIFESLLSWGQFLKQGSLGGFFWWLGERTFSGQTPGIAQAALNGELVLRPYGTFPHPNVLAGFLVVILPLLLTFKIENSWEKVVKVLATGLSILTIFLTFSRLSWIAAFLIFIWWLVVQKKWRYFFLLAVFLVFGFGLLEARFETLWTTDRESWQKRQELNLAAWEMIKAQPLFGVGLGNFLVELPNFHPEKKAARFLQPAHNVYLMVGAEMGILTLVALSGFLFLTYKRLLKKQFNNATMKQSLFLSFSTLLFLAFFDHYSYTLQQGQLLIALIFGIVWAKINESQN